VTRALPLCLLVACDSAGDSAACEASEVYDIDEWFILGGIYGGGAPWDPLWTDPLVADRGEPSGVLVPVIGGVHAWAVEPFLDPPLVTESSHLYRLVEEPVDTTLVAVGAWAGPPEPIFEIDEDDCAGPEPPRWYPMGDRWDVRHYGRAQDFDPESAVGRWDLTPNLVLVGGDDGYTALIDQYLSLSLEILSVAEGKAEFRVISHDDGSCVVLHDQGTLSATGEFTWSKVRIDAETEPAPLVIYDPSLRLGFDGSEFAAGGEGSAIVDVRASEGGEFDVCRQFADLCGPCADDSHESCLPLAAFSWTAVRVADATGRDLPSCGFDFADTGVVPDFDCGWDGTLCAFASFIGVAPLLRKRRRDKS